MFQINYDNVYSLVWDNRNIKKSNLTNSIDF